MTLTWEDANKYLLTEVGNQGQTKVKYHQSPKQ